MTWQFTLAARREQVRGHGRGAGRPHTRHTEVGGDAAFRGHGDAGAAAEDELLTGWAAAPQCADKGTVPAASKQGASKEQVCMCALLPQYLVTVESIVTLTATQRTHTHHGPPSLNRAIIENPTLAAATGGDTPLRVEGLLALDLRDVLSLGIRGGGA